MLQCVLQAALIVKGLVFLCKFKYPNVYMSNINYMREIGANELVFNTDVEKGVYSGGFNVNSIMMKSGLSPIMTLNTQTGGSNKVSDLFESLVIPSWALSYGGNRVNCDYKDDSDEDSGDIDDDLHDRLLDLVKEHENNAQKNKQNKKTRKQKNYRLNNKKNSGTKKNKNALK